MIRQRFNWTTNASGAATVYKDGSSVPLDAIMGELCAVKYIPGTTDTGATVTLTCVGVDGSSQTLLSKATAGTSTVWFYPRTPMHKASDGSALTGTSGYDLTELFVDGYLKVTIASGGDTLSGSLIAYIED